MKSYKLLMVLILSLGFVFSQSYTTTKNPYTGTETTVGSDGSRYTTTTNPYTGTKTTTGSNGYRSTTTTNPYTGTKTTKTNKYWWE